MQKNNLTSRKIFHIVFAIVFAGLYAFFFSQEQMIKIGFVLFLLMIIFEIGKFIIPKNNFLYQKCIGLMKENEVRTVTSLFWTILLFWGLVIWLPVEGFLYVLLISGIADPMASLCGVKYGSVKLFGRKTWQGSFAFFVTAFVVSFFMLAYYDIGSWSSIVFYSLLIVFIATIVEAISNKVDDNLTVALALAILYKLFL